jgi:hypothetical protein
MEFHLKYFTLGSSPSNEASQTGAARNPLKWTDLSFLEIQSPKTASAEKDGMFEAHFSFIICGSQESRWAAYAFDDTEFVEEEDLYEKIFCGGGQWDPIASCLSGNDVDANLPIWNSREYFLSIVARRMAQAAKSWDALLRTINCRIDQYVS